MLVWCKWGGGGEGERERKEMQLWWLALVYTISHTPLPDAAAFWLSFDDLEFLPPSDSAPSVSVEAGLAAAGFPVAALFRCLQRNKLTIKRPKLLRKSTIPAGIELINYTCTRRCNVANVVICTLLCETNRFMLEPHPPIIHVHACDELYQLLYQNHKGGEF